MQSLITIIFILSVIAFSLQLTLINRNYVVYIWLFIIGIFVWFMHSLAIEQSYSRFREQAFDSTLVGNFMVLQIIEAIGGLLLSIYLIRLHYNEPVKKTFRYFKYLPGIILFPALFYIESYLFLKIPGIPFRVLATILAVLFPAALFTLKYIFKKLVSEFDLRLEIKFLVHLFQLIMAVIISIRLFRLPVQGKTADFPVAQLSIMPVFVIISILIGRIIYYYKFKKLKKRNTWMK